MAFNGEKIAFVGAGVMGEAMIKGLLHQKIVQPASITAADPRAEHLELLRERYGICTTTDNADAARGANALVLSVKPQVMAKVLPELRGQVDGVSLIVSIVAGVQIKSIADSLLNVRIVRSMPNTPGQIGKGVTVWDPLHLKSQMLNASRRRCYWAPWVNGSMLMTNAFSIWLQRSVARDQLTYSCLWKR